MSDYKEVIIIEDNTQEVIIIESSSVDEIVAVDKEYEVIEVGISGPQGSAGADGSSVTLIGGSGVIVTESPADTWTISVSGNVEVDAVQTINSVAPSGGEITISIDGYTYTSPTDGVLNFVQTVPLSVTLNGGSTNETGDTVASVNLTWSYNDGDSDVDTSQTLNQGIGAVTPLSSRSYLYNTPITTDTTFTITSVDSVRGTDSDSTSVRFGLRVYSGVTTATVMTSGDVVTDADYNNITLGSNPDYDDTYDCTGGRYYYYAYPDSWGLLSGTNTKVNGLSFSDWSDNAGGAAVNGFTVDIENAFGVVTTYRVYRVFNLQNGSAIPVEYRN